MHKLMELKDILCNELEKYSKKELTAGNLEIIDKLAHAVKNLDKIIDGDGEYSHRMYYDRDGMDGRMSYAKRDRMGRYSRESGYSTAHENIVQELRDLMDDAPDHQTRQDIHRIVERLEKM